jgi:hypothetical protein
MRGNWFAVLGAASVLAGCSSIVEGSKQEIAVTTTPPGASCSLNREGEKIAAIDKTPGSVTIEKTKNDITVICELDGYQKTDTVNESGTAAATFGNILLGGAVGWVIDSATGSDNKYDTPLTIALTPNPPGVTAPLAAPVTVATSLLPPPPISHSVTTSPGSVKAAPMAATVDFKLAEIAAQRFRVLHQLAGEGLMPQDQYESWARQNAGAFLLYTAAPPFVGLNRRPPSHDDLAHFLQETQTRKSPTVGEAERQALFRALMPMDGPRSAPLKPPADAEALKKWYAFLDRVRDDGLLPAEMIEAEKAAINEARSVEGLPAVAMSETVGGVVR